MKLAAVRGIASYIAVSLTKLYLLHTREQRSYVRAAMVTTTLSGFE